MEHVAKLWRWLLHVLRIRVEPRRGPAPNVYLPLKAGRRSVVVAIVDHGTTSLLRFGEAEFDRWRIAGTVPDALRSARGTSQWTA